MYTFVVMRLTASWLMIAGLLVSLGRGVKVIGWVGSCSGRCWIQGKRRGLALGVGRWYVTSGGACSRVGLVRRIGGTAPGVLLRVLRRWVRLERRRTRFLVGFVDVVTCTGSLLAGPEV